jgi:hypothetical protein
MYETRYFPDIEILIKDLKGKNSNEIILSYLDNVKEDFKTFHSKMVNCAKSRGIIFRVRANVQGFTYLCDGKNKAFLFLCVCSDCLSINFFTGNGDMDGLSKGTWVNRKDMRGSERYHVNDQASIIKAVEFAMSAYDIAMNWQTISNKLR